MRLVPMIWNNQCRDTRRMLALWVGNDLGEGHVAGIERHLATCPQCRDVCRDLQNSHQALCTLPMLSVAGRSESASIWPGISQQIRQTYVATPILGWRRWLPTGALAAACVAMLAVFLASLAPVSSPFRNHRFPVVQGRDIDYDLKKQTTQSDRTKVHYVNPDLFRNF